MIITSLHDNTRNITKCPAQPVAGTVMRNDNTKSLMKRGWHPPSALERSAEHLFPSAEQICLTCKGEIQSQDHRRLETVAAMWRPGLQDLPGNLPHLPVPWGSALCAHVEGQCMHQIPPGAAFWCKLPLPCASNHAGKIKGR